MKKIISALILMTVVSTSAAADMENRKRTDPLFVLLDIVIYRPLGVAVTAGGAAVFAGLSPLTALASIPDPHDAFEKTYKVLIRMPARYTFVRPVGDKSLSGYGPFYNEKH
jgi:hypothetical protein